MNVNEVISKIGEHKLQLFYDFMYGKTIGINPDGSYDFYSCDVEDFINETINL